RALHGELSGLEDVEILIAAASGGEPLRFSADLKAGQKTGFFLDQSANTRLAARELEPALGKKVRILDLCCYVGQWSTQLSSHILKSRPGRQVEVTAFDSSAKALELARRNIERAGAKVESIKGDILEDLAA